MLFKCHVRTSLKPFYVPASNIQRPALRLSFQRDLPLPHILFCFSSLLKIHTGEKSKKCNPCEYASSWGQLLSFQGRPTTATYLVWFSSLLKIHTGEKSEKCNNCEYASSQASSKLTKETWLLLPHISHKIDLILLFLNHFTVSGSEI